VTRRVAAIDIGSNTLLCLLAERGEDGNLRRVIDLCRFGRLSEGLDRNGTLAGDAIERCLGILKEFRQMIDDEGVEIVACVATEAVRKAENGNEFTMPGEIILGTPIEVISGGREAALTHRAAYTSLPILSDGEAIIADVGGASTEVIHADGSEIVAATSLPIGAVRLTERHERILGAERRTLIERDIREYLDPLALPQGVPLVAAAGTATTLASMALKLPEYDPDAVHGFELDRLTLKAWVDRLFSLSAEDRQGLVGLDARRADVIPAGAAIFQCLAARVEATTCIVSDRGVRWGLAYEQLDADSAT